MCPVWAQAKNGYSRICSGNSIQKPLRSTAFDERPATGSNQNSWFQRISTDFTNRLDLLRDRFSRPKVPPARIKLLQPCTLLNGVVSWMLSPLQKSDDNVIRPRPISRVCDCLQLIGRGKCMGQPPGFAPGGLLPKCVEPKGERPWTFDFCMTRYRRQAGQRRYGISRDQAKASNSFDSEILGPIRGFLRSYSPLTQVPNDSSSGTSSSDGI